MVKDVMTGTYIYNDENINFNFYTDLSMNDRLKFVNSVTDLLIGDNYNYIIKNLIFDFFIIDIFTDIDISEIKESPNFINDVEDMLDKTNIVEIVKVNAIDGLIDELNKAIDFNIEYKTGIHRNVLTESLSDLVNTIKTKIDSFDMDSIMGMAQEFSNITDEFTMENLIDAYTKTDVFKKNQQELEDKNKRMSDLANAISDEIDVNNKK